MLLQTLPLALVVSCAPLMAWSFGGLEAPLLCALSTIGIALLRDALRPGSAPNSRLLAGSGLVFGLACLTRLDAGLFAALGMAFLLKPAREERSPRVLLIFAASVACVVGPWLIWKLVYYGGVLPNTYYVKAVGVSWDRVSWGLVYFREFALEPPFALVLLASGALRAGFRRSLDWGSVYALTAILSYIAWVVYVGGDQMPAHRLLVPIVPTVAWLSLELWLPDLRRLRDSTLGAVAMGLALLVLAAHVPLRAPNLNSTAFVGAVVGQHIAVSWPPGSLIALNTAGSTPYYAPGFRYVDMLGLNDAHIGRRDVPFVRIPGQRLPGHAKGDGAYVLDRQPDYIILGPANGAVASQPWFLSDLEIAEDPRFRGDYRLRRKRLSVQGVDGFRRFPETSGGELAFTWYERRPGL